MADTVNSPFSLKAFSISSGYVYGGFFGAGGVSGMAGFSSITAGSSSGTFRLTISSRRKFSSHARLAQSLSSSGDWEHFLRLHFDLSHEFMVADILTELTTMLTEPAAALNAFEFGIRAELFRARPRYHQSSA